jgi:hypothetical protein
MRRSGRRFVSCRAIAPRGSQWRMSVALKHRSKNELPVPSGRVWRSSAILKNELPPTPMSVAPEHHFEKRTPAITDGCALGLTFCKRGWVPETPGCRAGFPGRICFGFVFSISVRAVTPGLCGCDGEAWVAARTAAAITSPCDFGATFRKTNLRREPCAWAGR